MGDFPVVSARSHADGRSYNHRHKEWRNGPWQGLKVTAKLATSYIPDAHGAIHLDGVLSAALMGSRMVGATIAPRREDFVVPLPLRLIWVDDTGRPLWAATEMRAPPEAPQGSGTLYLHKRYPTDRAPLAGRQTVLTTAGRYKDVRMPLGLRVAPEVVGWCIGIADPVRALLDGVTHIGRKGAIGQGRVASWSVEPADVDLTWVMEKRRVPLAALGDTPVAANRITPRGSWTPPYWLAPCHAPCREASWTT